jgi:hypothetical protein
MNKIILIGNASNVLDLEFGNKIDEFDIVVRFGRFQVTGFEEFVGWKCTHWILNNTDFVHYHLEQNFKTVCSSIYGLRRLVVMSNSPNLEKAMETERQINFRINTIKIKRPDRVVIPSVWSNRCLKLLPKIGGKMSSGLCAIVYFVERFGQVTIHGFDSAKSDHYWGVHSSLDDHKTWNSPITAHDWKGQANFIAALIEEGKIKTL